MKHNQFIMSLATLLTLAITGCREKTTTEKVEGSVKQAATDTKDGDRKSVV